MNFLSRSLKIEKLKNNEKKFFFKISKDYLKEITKKKSIQLIKIKENFSKIIYNKGKIFWIKYDDIKIGFVVLYINRIVGKKNGDCYIRDFFIFKKFRFKNLGRKTFGEIVNFCKKKELKIVKINILPSNRKVVKFWRKLKFKKKNSSYYFKINNDSY